MMLKLTQLGSYTGANAWTIPFMADGLAGTVWRPSIGPSKVGNSITIIGGIVR